MSNVVSMHGEDRRYDEAARWITRLDEELTGDQLRELQEWLTEDPENLLLLEDMASMWDKMQSLSRLSHLFPQKPSRRPSSRIAAFGLAASLLIGILVGLFALPNDGFLAGNNPDVIAHKDLYQTSVGERSTVTLLDGSLITLNTNTLVEVELTESYRLISLARGEIHVKVAKDEKRPLAVVANGKVVQAVGTEFNVEITPDKDIELVVTEGRVRVAVLSPSSQKHADTSFVGRLPSSAPEVSAGQQLVFGKVDAGDNLADKVLEVAPDDIEVKLSWKSGNLIFRGEPLEEAVKEVARYTSVEFVIQDESLRNIRVAGLFRAGDVESLLSALRENFNIVAHRSSDRRILLSAQ